jgi:hypothetical protein
MSYYPLTPIISFIGLLLNKRSDTTICLLSHLISSLCTSKKKKKNQFRKACVNLKKPLGMAAIYSLYIINKSGGLIFYKVRCLLPFNSITRAFWGVMLDWIMIESNTSD